MLNVEFVSLVWILNLPSNAVVASTLYQNVMVELKKSKCLFSLELFSLSHFISTNIFYLINLYVFFVNILKKVNFSDSKPSPKSDESSVW